MSAAPPSDPGGTADRVRCAYCGANNFPTAAACWQCQRPLKSLRAGLPPPSLSAPGPALPDWVNTQGARRAPGADLALAPKAAAALGLLFPWAGLPIGLAFLMLDDPRRARLGWTAIGWSVIGTVLNVIPLLLLWPLVKSFLPHPGGLPNVGTPGAGAPGGLPPLDGGEQFLLPHVLIGVKSWFHPDPFTVK